MTPETKLEALYRSLIAVCLTAIALPFIGVWAIMAALCEWSHRSNQ